MNVDKIRLLHDGHVQSLTTNLFLDRPCSAHKGEDCDCKICRYKERNRRKEYIKRAKFKVAFVEKVSRNKVFILFGWHCAMCGVDTPKHLDGTKEPNSPTLDHIKPLSKGGTHEYSNVQLLCRRCNCHIKNDTYKDTE